ncbi:MAG: RDD family protein [Deltaproteobacteria bacterium]|nr:RDD family protein [Deltaproteobacteria bacterium]
MRADPEARIDCVATVETPEHLVVQFELAGPFQRGAAWMIDGVIRTTALLAMGLALLAFAAAVPGLQDLGGGAALLAWFVVEWFYYVLFEWRWDGQTPGKRWMGLRVVRTGGYPISGTDALLRNLLRAADGMPLACYLVGTACSAFDPRFRRLGDWLADTMVVVDRRDRSAALAPSESADAVLLAALPKRIAMPPEERRTLDALVARMPAIGRPRVSEIASDYAAQLAGRLGVAGPVDPVALMIAVHARIHDREGGARRRR